MARTEAVVSGKVMNKRRKESCNMNAIVYNEAQRKVLPRFTSREFREIYQGFSLLLVEESSMRVVAASSESSREGLLNRFFKEFPNAPRGDYIFKPGPAFLAKVATAGSSVSGIASNDDNGGLDR